MGLSMIFIIMSHQPFLLSVPFKIFHFLGHFGVDAFFFLSGLGCYYSLNKRKTVLGRTDYENLLSMTIGIINNKC